MSLKGQTFHLDVNQPLVSSNYAIFIPGVTKAKLRCHASSMPFDMRNEYTLSVSGEPVHLPGKTKSSGEWTCSIYESEVMDSLSQLEQLCSLEVQTIEGVPCAINMHDVFVFIFDSNEEVVYQRILRYAWVTSISPIKLSANGAADVVSYEVKFHYSFCD